MACHKRGIIPYIQHLGVTATLKIWEGKNVQNSARFRTTFEFVGKFVSGELWSTNNKVIDVDVDPPKIDCARDFE